MIKTIKPITIFIFLQLFFVISCSTNKKIPTDNNSIIYFGGDILTMESDCTSSRNVYQG